MRIALGHSQSCEYDAVKYMLLTDTKENNHVLTE